LIDFSGGNCCDFFPLGFPRQNWPTRTWRCCWTTGRRSCFHRNYYCILI